MNRNLVTLFKTSTEMLVLNALLHLKNITLPTVLQCKKVNFSPFTRNKQLFTVLSAVTETNRLPIGQIN